MLYLSAKKRIQLELLLAGVTFISKEPFPIRIVINRGVVEEVLDRWQKEVNYQYTIDFKPNLINCQFIN